MRNVPFLLYSGLMALTYYVMLEKIKESTLSPAVSAAHAVMTQSDCFLCEFIGPSHCCGVFFFPPTLHCSLRFVTMLFSTSLLTQGLCVCLGSSLADAFRHTDKPNFFPQLHKQSGCFSTVPPTCTNSPYSPASRHPVHSRWTFVGAPNPYMRASDEGTASS